MSRQNRERPKSNGYALISYQQLRCDTNISNRVATRSWKSRRRASLGPLSASSGGTSQICLPGSSFCRWFVIAARFWFVYVTRPSASKAPKASAIELRILSCLSRATSACRCAFAAVRRDAHLVADPTDGQAIQ
jgi:hypothetical protein